MSEDLKIYPLGTTSANDLPSTSQYEHVPDFNSTSGVRWLMIGNSGSGKTLLVKSLLVRSEFGIEPTFGENRFIVSDTIDMDSSWDDLQLPKHHKIAWDAGVVQQIMDYSKKSKTGICMVLDDLISNASAINKTRGSLLTKLFVQGRHWKVRGLFICTQKYNGLPPVIREQCTHCCVFKLNNKRERESFFEDFAIEGIEAAYHEATSVPYGFLFIDKNKQKCYANFERELI